MNLESGVRIPTNSRELFKWVIFEPIFIKKYSNSLNRKQAAREFLKAYSWIIVFTLCFWVLANLVIILLNLPMLVPDLFREEITAGWLTQTTWLSRFIFYSKYFALELTVGLADGLALGFAYGFAYGLAEGLVVGFACGLTFGLIGGLTGGLTGGLVVGITFGLILGLASGLSFGLTFRPVLILVSGIAFGLSGGLSGGLKYNLLTGVSIGVGFIICFYLSYFRIFPFYLVHFVKSWFAHDLFRNPYHLDGFIWLPLLRLNKKLLEQAGQKPREALKFVDFLVDYRPLQKNLAMKLTHAAVVGLWLQQEFTAEILKTKPLISDDKPGFQPSPEWFQTLEKARKDLVASEMENNAGFRSEYYRDYLSNVNELAELTRKKESSRWNHLYFEALERWQAKVQEEYKQHQLVAKTEEPVAQNVYRTGRALTPEHDQATFLGRDDIKDELRHKILTSPSMPLFLVHGQRQVGKTSLLKFLYNDFLWISSFLISMNN